MSTPRGWDSHVWTEQTFLAHLNDPQKVSIRTTERLPQSFDVPCSLLLHYCPQAQPVHAGGPFDLETSNRAVLIQVFNWLHTGNIARDADWHMATELYFIAARVGSIALARSAMTQLQKTCREPNQTELFHYGHIAVIEEMVGPDSALYHYIEDTYFNHWTPDNDANDSASEHEKPGLFFKKLFERSFREQRDAENCSCCHDYCKYHDHQSEAERLATCGHLPIHTPSVGFSVNVTKDTTQPDLLTRKPCKGKAAVRISINNHPMSEDEDSPLRETRSTAPRANTPRMESANGSWLDEKCSAPEKYPPDYHGMLTSLPQVKAIKAPNWLLEGLKASGIERLPEPDRIISAAMGWNAEEYAQTKWSFFDQYDVTNGNRNHWLNTLKFGGSRQKVRADMLLAMWESLGWLRRPEVVVNKELNRLRDPVPSRARSRISVSGKMAWSQEEKDAMGKIMGEIEEDPACVNLGLLARSALCAERLKLRYGHNRTEGGVHAYWSIVRALVHPAATEGADQGEHVVQPSLDGPITVESEGEINPRRRRFGVAWAGQETKAMLDFMRAFDTEPAGSHFSAPKRAELCGLYLKAAFDTDRTAIAISLRYNKARREEVAEDQSRRAHVTDSDHIIPHTGPATVTEEGGQNQYNTPLVSRSVGRSSQAGRFTTGSPATSVTPINPIKLTVVEAATKQPQRWTEEEHDVLIKVYKEIEADPALVHLTAREREKLCSKRLKARHGTERTFHSVKGRLSRFNLSNNTSAKRDRDEDDYNDLESLITSQKRRETKATRQAKSRFVNERFDTGEE
ncbi:hypothetical protein E4T39_05727 [Aureobasidium subglaciale]|nr:hypothetical protein E4T39_05727 [Aureobasidium subglaciale]